MAMKWRHQLFKAKALSIACILVRARAREIKENISIDYSIMNHPGGNECALGVLSMIYKPDMIVIPLRILDAAATIR